MRVNTIKKIIAAILAAVLCFGVLPSRSFFNTLSAVVKAANADSLNEAYADGTSLMPIGPAFTVDTLLSWEPTNDPDSDYSRSVVPLADRYTGFTVNDYANPDAKLMVCSLANSKHDATNAQGQESFSSYAFNYWQYATSFVYWSGSKRGQVVVPTGEFTDAAHTNGVPVMGTIFFDWNGDSSVVENFVRNYRSVADKLIEVMEYYGFDGYFFNEETGVDYTTAGNLRSMIAYMRQQRPNMLIGWYDSITDSGNLSYQDAVNGYNSGWVSAGVNEFFMNYNWTTQDVNTTVSTMQNLGKSQYEAFAGLDVQQNCMNTYFSSNYLLNNSNKLKLSLALYCPNSTMGLSGDGADFHEVERQFYVNGGDPRSTSSSGWAGMSRFFADHTTIISAPFVTNFNSGHGKAFYIDGVKSRDAEWSYQSVQDVMPTWTWIIDSNGQKLSGAYDFEDAYNGGSSIKFYGSLTANKPNNIMLYSTNLDINGSTNIAVTAKNDRGLMKLVAYYGDSSTSSYANCQKVTFALDASSGGWTTSNVSLASLSGKKLYALGFEIGGTSNVSDYQVNIGRLAVTDSEAAAASASNARLEEIIYLDAYTAEARIKWNGNNASSYEIYRLNADGTRTLIMETPNTAYYIPNLVRNDDQADVTIEVVPVNANGVRGESSRFTIDWPYENGDTEKLSDVTVPVNICPLAEVTGYSAQNDGEPAWKAIDGTSENGSKWCATNKQSGWMTIKLDQPRTIKRIRIEHAEYGGEAQNMNTIAFSVQYKSGNNWVTVYSTTNNSSAVTDELITPVTAQEWRLYISNSGSSAWGAIRIYEWQMFETTERNRTDIVLMKFASAKNNKGASDTFSLTHAPTGSTVRLYLRDANGNYTQIASKEAQSSTVSFTGLDYGSDAGRVFYTVQEGKQEESIKLSTAFDAEPGAVKYSITVVQPANGSVAASATSATAGTTVKLTANPAEGYTLDYFTLDGERINGDTFIMPARNVEVSAVFTANAYSITVVQPTGGSVAASATSATAGTTVKLTATPAEGYTLDYFTLDGARINGDTFIMPARNVEVSAVFTANAYSITVVQPTNGMVAASATSATAGTTVELTASPAEGYTLDYFTLDGERINGNTFSMPARNVEVSAVFTANAYSITVVQPTGGTVSASATSAAAGATIELTATPAEGYTLDYFTLDGERINGNTFIMPARNVEVSAVFTANAYSITVVQPTGGTVSASKLSAFFGEAVELTAVPDEGYELSHYVVNGAANNGGTFTMPARDVIVTAVFTKVAEPSVNLALNATVYYSNKKYPDYAKNGPQHAFDGKMSDREADKWHASGINGWVAFDIHTPVANPILKIYHAGSAGEDSNLNTSSWDVYILNERYLTEEAYFNMDRSTQNRVCQIAWFWKRIHVTTGNTADISIDHIDMPEARRLFKINMRKTNQTGYPYHLNVYEIEMYAGN
jgi:endo-beta-N-acetylglucosaminidase D